ncbi:MAG: CDP-alcohol phosphatidyltransferase family protein [Candidatus Omnitrophota bacterium]
MESISQLRTICQKPREQYDVWYGKFVARRFSIYITRVFLAMNLTPNTATSIFLLTGIVACVFFTEGSKIGAFTAALFLQLWYILDHVDGEIARYRNTSTVTGIYYDNICHYIIHPLVFIGIGYGLWRKYAIGYVFLFSSSAAISSMLLILLVDLRNSVLYFAGKRDLPLDTDKLTAKNPSLARKLFSALHKLCTFPPVMNIITLATITELFCRCGVVFAVVIFYGIAMPVVWICKLSYIVAKKELD